MPATVSGNPNNFYPSFDIAFRFNDAAFDSLTTEQKDAEVDAAAVRIAGYFQGSTGDDPDGADEVFPIPDMRDRAVNVNMTYQRDYSPGGQHFTAEVRIVDDPSQTTGIPPGQVKARIETVVQNIVDEVTALESSTGYTIEATITYL